MPIDLSPGENPPLNVAMTPKSPNGEWDPWSYDANKDCYIDDDEVLKAAADYTQGLITTDQYKEVEYLWLHKVYNPACPQGELSIARFYVFTRPDMGNDVGLWSARCDIKNFGEYPASGSLHCTGELHRVGGDPRFLVPIDETREFTVQRLDTYQFLLEDWQFPDCLINDQGWLKIDTSWGESTVKCWFRPGYYSSDPALLAFDITSHSVSLRFGKGGGEARRWEISIRTPPTGTAEQLIEDKLNDSRSWLGLYYYGRGLLSKRNYRAYGSAGNAYPQTDFRTL